MYQAPCFATVYCVTDSFIAMAVRLIAFALCPARSVSFSL